jgi:glucose/arabinose dehydrogenase
MSRLVMIVFALSFTTTGCAQPRPLPLENIKLPKGFTIEVVARVDNARGMALGDKGTLFVGSMQAGKVYAIRLASGSPAQVFTAASGLQLPAGVAFRDGALYVSAVNSIVRLDDIENRLANPPAPVVVSDRFPTETHHGWKFIAFGPDGKLYVPVGAPCNICEPDPDRYANIMRMNRDGSGLASTGIRATANCGSTTTAATC